MLWTFEWRDRVRNQRSRGSSIQRANPIVNCTHGISAQRMGNDGPSQARRPGQREGTGTVQDRNKVGSRAIRMKFQFCELLTPSCSIYLLPWLAFTSFLDIDKFSSSSWSLFFSFSVSSSLSRSGLSLHGFIIYLLYWSKVMSCSLFVFVGWFMGLLSCFEFTLGSKRVFFSFEPTHLYKKSKLKGIFVVKFRLVLWYFVFMCLCRKKQPLNGL